MLISAILVLLLGGFTAYAVTSKTNNITHEKKISKDKKTAPPKRLSKAEAKKINDKFYSHKIIDAGGDESCFVGEYPSTFSKLINKSELVVTGEVVGLNSYVSGNFPYTAVSLKIDNILKGDNKKLNKTIKVIFMGGNITRKKDASINNFKLDENTDPNEIITIEYGRLPRAGEQMALGLSKLPKETNDTQENSWITTYVEKSTFFQDSDGKYRRTPVPAPISDTGVRDLSGQKEDKKMNDAMNNLINKTKNKDSKKNWKISYHSEFTNN